MRHVTAPRLATALFVLAVSGGSVSAQGPDLRAVARNLVKAGMIKTGDKVLIVGSVRDAPLLEHVAIETMKVGGDPLVTLSSEALIRRSYDEVPSTYATRTSALNLALVEVFDAQIAVDVGETEGLLAGVPVERRAARAKAGQPVADAFLKRSVRFVNLGNGLYPTATLSRRLGVPQGSLAATFWRAANVPARTLREKAESVRAAFGSDFGLATQLAGATVTVGGRTIVANGVLR